MKRIISLTLISALVLSVCACGTTGSAETDTETIPVEAAIDESVEVETSETSESAMETEIDDDIDSFFTVETNSYSNPILSADTSPDSYNAICSDVVGSNWNLVYGFDNEYSISKLREYIFIITGEDNNIATLSDVNYFQGNERLCNNCAGKEFSEVFSENSFSPTLLCYVRAIMQINGWRFGIDEIPYEYLVDRFPYFMSTAVVDGTIQGSWEDMSDPDMFEVTDPLGFNGMYDFDIVLFTACTVYNDTRLSYIYNNPYGSIDNLTDDVLQVRDAETGRNVLVPTEEQYYQMMEDINSIPGCENVDIAVVETRENFYEAYGYYPEDIINDTMIYEGNISN